jgi:hypothetical protein
MTIRTTNVAFRHFRDNETHSTPARDTPADVHYFAHTGPVIELQSQRIGD